MIAKNVMIAKEDILELLNSTESYRVERTISTGNMDKFCEAICAFANDMPGSRKNGYLIIGAKDDGSIAGMKVDDALLKKIAGSKTVRFAACPLSWQSLYPCLTSQRYCY